MSINLRWTLTDKPTTESRLHEQYYSQKNIFSTIIIDCSTGLHISLLNYFSDLIVAIIGHDNHALFAMGVLSVDTEIAHEYVFLIRKDLVPKLLAETKGLDKKGFVFY